MRCFYDTGDKCLDYYGEFLNGNVWVHGQEDGKDWGKRVFVRKLSLDYNSKGITVIVQESSERAMVVSIVMDWDSHEALRQKEIYDVRGMVTWDQFVNMLSDGVNIVVGGETRNIHINGIWRSPQYDLVHVEDDAIHVVPRDGDCYDVFVAEWMRDVLAEDGIIYITW